MTVDPDAEYSSPVRLSHLPKGRGEFELAPNESERAAIATRLGAAQVTSFSGKVTVRADNRKIDIKGRIRASLVRTCVASLEHMDETIDEEFALDFIRGEDQGNEEDEHLLDGPEFHSGDEIDLGEILVQQLSLAMDPFPRKDGAASLADQFGREKEPSALAAAFLEAEKDKSNQ